MEFFVGFFLNLLQKEKVYLEQVVLKFIVVINKLGMFDF